jgi:hypothetical protein
MSVTNLLQFKILLSDFKKNNIVKFSLVKDPTAETSKGNDKGLVQNPLVEVDDKVAVVQELPVKFKDKDAVRDPTAEITDTIAITNSVFSPKSHCRRLCYRPSTDARRLGARPVETYKDRDAY